MSAQAIALHLRTITKGGRQPSPPAAKDIIQVDTRHLPCDTRLSLAHSFGFALMNF